MFTSYLSLQVVISNFMLPDSCTCRLLVIFLLDTLFYYVHNNDDVITKEQRT